jgi:PEP-CTERM motif-containing protein
MKRTHRFRLFVVCSFLILVAAAGYAARSTETRATPQVENESAAALGGAAAVHAARVLAGSQGGSPLAVSEGASFLAPAVFYARSRDVASRPAVERNAASSTPPTCATDTACNEAQQAVVVAADEGASREAASERRFGARLRRTAAGVAAAGAFVAVNEIWSNDGSENLSPARWYIAAGHFGDTTNVGLGLHGPWAPPKGSPASPWHPEPCYTTGSCAFQPPGSPPPGNDDPPQDPPPNGSPNDAGDGNQNPSDNSGTGNPYDGDPNKPPVISTTTTPEPSTVFLLATGLGLIALVQFRRRRVAIEAR